MKAPSFLCKAASALLAISMALPCEASVPINAVQAAAVAVVVKGIRTANSEPVEVHGSGFFTSPDGYLVTSYHLVSDLLGQGVDERTLTYHVTAQGQRQTGAIIAWKNDAADLMVLRARIGDLPVKPLKPNRAARRELRLIETPIFTGGYPEGYAFVADRGYIKSFEGPADFAAPAWVTNMNFKAGQSGSPVVLEDGRVAAVVKAMDLDAASMGILVPIGDIPDNYWQGVETQSVRDPAGFRSVWPGLAWSAALLTAILLSGAALLRAHGGLASRRAADATARQKNSSNLKTPAPVREGCLP